MLRPSHLPSLTCPTLCTLRFSMFSPLCVSSSLKPQQFSSLALLLTFLPKTFKHWSPCLPSQSFGWASSMVGSARLNGIASFSTGNNVGRGGGGEGREILVQHLLVGEDNLKLLLDLQQRISRGVDLSDLAVEYSTCPSKEQGGMLGWVRKGQMVPEFEEAAFNAPLNKVVRCKTKFGWHLLQVLSEREAALLQDIEPEELHAKMQDPCFLEEAQLIDVREPEEIAQASLPGFQVLPLRQFGKWGPEITDKFDPGKDTYVLCHLGMRSLQVAKWLQTQGGHITHQCQWMYSERLRHTFTWGFKRVYNVSGGIHAYAVKVDPSIPTY